MPSDPEYDALLWRVIDRFTKLGLNDDQIERYLLEITRLNPNPMAVFSARRVLKKMKKAPVAGRIFKDDSKHENTLHQHPRI